MDIKGKLFEMEMTGRAILGTPRKFDEKGELNIGEIIMAIIAIVIAAILVGSLLPTAVNNTTGGRNGSWNTSLLSTWDAIPIFEVLAGLLIFVAIIVRLSKN